MAHWEHRSEKGWKDFQFNQPYTNELVVGKISFSYQDYLHLPDDKRFEIIDGDLRMVPAPLTYHQKISGRLFSLVLESVKKWDLGEVLYAPVDVVLSQTDIVQPDLLFISKKRLDILNEQNVQGAPDLIVEILSPTGEKWDRQVKRNLYQKYGVQEYWLVDPLSQSLEILELKDNFFRTRKICTAGIKVMSPLLPGLSFLTEKIF